MASSSRHPRSRDHARSDAPRQVEALERRFALPPGARGRLLTLLALLSEDPLAPTAVRDPRRVLEDHLADSLVALDVPHTREAKAVADLGSGAGIPGLVLAIAMPDAVVALVESAGRKCSFLASAAEACSLSNVEVVCRRAEDWPEGVDRFDLVTARAVAPLPAVLEYAAPLLRVGGALVAWRGRRNPADERAAARAARELGLGGEDPIPVVPYPAARHRHLQRFVKLSPTPPAFPRRPGMARKRPLGAGG